MADFPKVARQALENQQLREGAAHPDVDLLTAFVEQAVTPREREQILAHLGQCPDCREVAILAGAAIPEVAQAVTLSKKASAASAPKSFWSWGPLRWTAAAATAAVVVSAVWLGQHELPKQQLMTGSETLPAVVQRQSEPSSPISSKPVQEQKEEGVQNRDLAAKDKATNENLKANALKSIAPPQKQVYEFSAKLDNFEKKKEASKDRTEARDDLLAPPAAPGASVSEGVLPKTSPAANVPATSGPILTGAMIAQKPRPAEESVSVNGAVPVRAQEAQPTMTYSRRAATDLAPAAQVPQAAPSTAQTNRRILQRAPVDDERAPASGANQLQSTVEANEGAESLSSLRKSENFTAKWRVTEAGELQQSFDSGHTWRVSLREISNFRAVASTGSAVWAGGDDAVLWRSSDYGQTWKKVVPDVSGRTPRGNVQSIQLSSPTAVAFKTSAGETWTSTDGGNTWSAANQ